MFIRGNITGNSVQRRSRSIPVLEELLSDYKKVLSQLGEEDSEEEDVHYASHEKWVVDLQACVNILLQEKLLRNTGERFHCGFPDFRYKLFYVDDIAVYKRQINEEISYNNDAMEMREESVRNMCRKKE
jgi:hypothetical protein